MVRSELVPMPGKAGHRACIGFLAAIACLALTVASARQLPVPWPVPPFASSPHRLAAAPAWDCWIDPGEGGGIRCIADRDVPLPLPDEFTDDDEAAEVLLELLHDYLHRAMPQRASQLVRERYYLLRRDDLWTIRLSSPPFETSWSDERPQLLVRSLLCRGAPGCPIRFHH
ncbi:MAG TPA: hypothetical protein VFV55_01315 [Usitatibacteraceae bacterium]|nr:hypothetical protein [Usitatibacteraceae bacterium]